LARRSTHRYAAGRAISAPDGRHSQDLIDFSALKRI